MQCEFLQLLIQNVMEKMAAYPSLAQHATVQYPEGSVWSVNPNNIQNPSQRPTVTNRSKPENKLEHVYQRGSLDQCPFQSSFSLSPLGNRGELDVKTRLFLRVKALWVNGKISSRTEWSSPLHNGDYGVIKLQYATDCIIQLHTIHDRVSSTRNLG